ncbi:DNA-binding transcriptional MerR regulator [Clostridium saccharoperbutylacetonicum]|uniref:Putative transcriptional regulator n=1 Tax=Clostridium saccharoperbutylacetonicum N1-4(HMT) TaxID=931276 RepID=M1LVY0_9CLOT|nr:MerR family transcriptional regulator [Clostridium saccharoperbutylacetonicum]AGF57325.1 putative transcriptional regulator [Clostridium saccharoperbutylacetonicum N1-4(HMT)]NRT61912.1 DNA-binding transcriptional MerR regulator [Clostridium saccharoperbutylacetonicum]NSB25240.1 DNA-binding transcriptional MerR regulator [Clostridium saccharoperbutylacetonicum]NSB44610.1 DNA-binding transcriptional MerR regulator [Clostridium saccharoperbutylacetonicum]
MKIGRFVEHNNLTIDTVRHYMDMSLIIPEKKGGQYDFDNNCQKDLEEVLAYKGMGFSLSEIKTIFMFKRLAKFTEYQENEYFKELFINKHNQLEQQLIEIGEMKERLESKLKELSEKKMNNESIIGVDIRALDILKCLKCGNDLELFEGKVSKNQIINGKLKCCCGEEYLIEDGILKITCINEKHTSDFDRNYINDYIKVTDSEYLDNVYRGIEWINKKVDFENLKNKVILELGSGIGFFLRNIYECLPDDSIYIAVDNDINRHKFLKNILAATNCRKNILFICSDFQKLPIKEKSIEVLIDISGTSNYSFDNEEFLLKLIDKYVKDEASIIGTYILFEKFALNSLIESKYRKNFMMDNVKDQILTLKYNIIDESISRHVESGGIYEDYFVDGEKVYSYIFIGRR